MKYAMHCVLTILLVLVAIFSQGQDASGLLEKSRKLVKAQRCVTYTYKAYWPNPVGEVDTLSGECEFVIGQQADFPYDFIAKADGWDMMYLDGNFQQVSHADKKIELHPDRERAVRMIKNGLIPIKYGPLMLLEETHWKYVRDTTITHSLGGFRMIERDTLVNGNRIVVERWLYIGKESLLPEWYVQQASRNGKVSQRIEFAFTDYVLSKKAIPLVYDLPAGYTSEVYGANPGPQALQAGAEAPVFQVTDIAGKPVDLKALRGKKVLLDFSVINCGYCKLAIDHMNGEGFALPNNVVGLYVNPIDKADRVSSYAQKSHIPFPVVADARAVGTMYGVSAYPTFFLIDENGMIQETVVGYQKEFLDKLGKK